MRRTILSFSFSAALLAGIATHVSSCAIAQRLPGEAPRPSAPAPAATVSVATLSVSAKARDHYRLALLAHQSARDEACNREITKALKASPNFAEAYLFRAILEISQHAYEAAVDDVLTAERLDAGLAWAPVALAEAYNGLRRYQDALPLLQNLRGSVGASWQVKFEMARAEVGLRRAEDAVYWSAQAVAIVPQGFSDGHLIYANALQLAARWSEAGRELRLYLAAPGPQTHRAQALSALAFAESKAAEQSSPTMAAR